MSRRTSGRAAIALRKGYQDGARVGNWALCKQIAEQMRGIDGSKLQYALADALEQRSSRMRARRTRLC